jgi:hypothetical protein
VQKKGDLPALTPHRTQKPCKHEESPATRHRRRRLELYSGSRRMSTVTTAEGSPARRLLGLWAGDLSRLRSRRPNACSVAEPNVDLALERLSPGVACDVALKALEDLLLRGRRGVGAMVRDEDVLPTVERVVPGERLIVEHI